MPLIHITLAGANLARHHSKFAAGARVDAAHSAGAALTVVSVTQLPLGAFSANGQPVAVGTSLQAMITAGTNSAAEKADFIFAAKSLLTAAIGPSDAPVYVALHELPAESWGYDGQTQAARKAKILIGETA
jgi:4-oxalocrotonate tautomerase